MGSLIQNTETVDCEDGLKRGKLCSVGSNRLERVQTIKILPSDTGDSWTKLLRAEISPTCLVLQISGVTEQLLRYMVLGLNQPRR